MNNAITSLTQNIKNTLINIIGDDEEIINDLVQTYKDDTQELMKSLHEAIVSHDLKTITLVSHTLKSSSGNLGAYQLAELADKQERLTRAGDIDMVVTQLPQLEAEYKRVCLALQLLN